MFTCKDLSDTASDYLEGPTTFWQRLVFRTHLFICRDCRNYVAQLQLAIGVARQMPQPEPPSEAEVDAIMSHLEAAADVDDSNRQ